MHYFDLDYKNEEGEVIYEYESADSDRMSPDGLYSELLDSIIKGLDLFAQNPYWIDGDGFCRFEELMTCDKDECDLIYEVSNIEEAFGHMKTAVVTMLQGMDIEML